MKMSTRDHLLCLTTGLALIALSACGPTDPSTTNNDDDNNGTAMDMGSDPQDQGDNTVEDQGNTTEDQGNTTEDQGNGDDDQGNGDDDQGNGDDDQGNNNNNGGGGGCDGDITYEGQMGGDGPGNGGVFVVGAGAYEVDSGLKAVVDAIQADIDNGVLVEDSDRTDDINEDERELEDGQEFVVTGAVVTATNRPDDRNNYSYARSIHFQDQLVAANLFLPFESEYVSDLQTDVNGNPLIIKVGDKLNFKVKIIKGRSGVGTGGALSPQLARIVDIEKVAENVDVGVEEKTGQPITPEDINKLIRVRGTTNGMSALCDAPDGNNICYDLLHGSESTIFRVRDDAFGQPDEDGDCVTFVGPVGVFMGRVQLDAQNFNWFRGPFEEQ